jgi:hypothetical protein
MVRHAVAAVLSLALLHLNVVRADAACGSHPAATSAPAAVVPAADHHAHHDAPPAPQSDEEQCDAPQARDCCAAVASCAIAFDAGMREGESASDGSARAIAPPVVTAPLSVNAAPEPPPPRV